MLQRTARVLFTLHTVKVFIRSYGSVQCHERVRVRFAPSPTGYLHLGGLRTALYNYLFAKANSGSFILRIEDTDQNRLVEGAVEKIEYDLAWAGIEPDESPSKGGPFGPYRQSERLSLYRKHAEQLVDSGYGYRCFCTSRRLDLLRREALRTRQVPRYDNRCRSLSNDDVKSRIQRGESYCIRLKLEGESGWNDLVLGSVCPDVSVEGDPVLLKTDGYPTYHLACVVDDHLMEITHVLRGVEWQISTPKHLQIYRALKWQPPVFAHLPLLLNSDGTKLSKRQGGVTVTEQRSSGVLPRSLVTWLTLAGGGFPHISEADSCLQPMTPEELVPLFDLSRVNRASCRLPLDKLPRINRLEIERQLKNSVDASQLVGELRNMLQEKYRGRSEETFLDISEEHIRQVLHWALPRTLYLSDLLSPQLSFLWEQPREPLRTTDDDMKALGMVYSVLGKLSETDFEKTHLSSELKATAKSAGVPFGRLMKLMRVALSGQQEGPSVAEMLAILGPQTALTRLDKALTVTQN